ncbi:MAG: DUF1579 domain-containing protein [Phycisphaerales bacterium]
MSNLLKRSLMLVACSGVCASVLLAQGGMPSTPPMPSKDQVTDQTKDAAKDAMEQAKKKAEEMKKQAEEAAKKAMGGGDGKPAAGSGMPDEKMMAEMMKGMSPGPMHEWLKKWEGNWDLAAKAYMSPGAPPSEMKMTSEATMSMGGRFLIEKVSGQIDMGMGPAAFEGVSTMGYDNYQKKFVSTWYDNMSTGIMIETGTVDATGKVLTSEGENWNMALGKMTKTKSVATIIDDKTRTLEMWSPGPDGKMMKNMEITYTRK